MNFVRKAEASDASRIAEIIITNYRVNFYPFFLNDEFYFDELNVVDMASEYCEGSDALNNTYVYDDGVVKGIIRVNGSEIEKLYVEPQFQSHGIGAELLRFAVDEKKADNLWALEYNKRGIAFYQRNGFELTGEKMIEDEWVPLLKMRKADIDRVILRPVLRDSADKAVLDAINVEAFPECERTSLDDLYDTGNEGNLDIIGIYVCDEPVGFFAVRKYGSMRYLAYFAVASSRRSSGIGSRALRSLIGYYPDCQIVVEFEAPDNDSENNEIRRRRRDFYLRNGFKETGWYRFYDYAEFEVACSSDVFDKDSFDIFNEYLNSLIPVELPDLYRKD